MVSVVNRPFFCLVLEICVLGSDGDALVTPPHTPRSITPRSGSAPMWERFFLLLLFFSWFSESFLLWLILLSACQSCSFFETTLQKSCLVIGFTELLKHSFLDQRIAPSEYGMSRRSNHRLRKEVVEFWFQASEKLVKSIPVQFPNAELSPHLVEVSAHPSQPTVLGRNAVLDGQKKILLTFLFERSWFWWFMSRLGFARDEAVGSHFALHWAVLWCIACVVLSWWRANLHGIIFRCVCSFCLLLMNLFFPQGWRRSVGEIVGCSQHCATSRRHSMWKCSNQIQVSLFVSWLSHIGLKTTNQFVEQNEHPRYSNERQQDEDLRYSGSSPFPPLQFVCVFSI